MARKATRKQSAGRRPAQKKTAAAGKKSAARRTASSTARRRSAARATATRQRRSRPAPKPPSLVERTTAAIRGTISGAVAAAAALPWGNSSADAIEILEEEHRRFEDLLRQGEETTARAGKGRRKLLETLRAALEEHELMEEKVLYPALQSHPEARDVVLEGYEEHHVADLIIGELRGVATSDAQWGAKFKVLKENIEHHIEEEEGEMFRVARRVFSREELRELASAMLALKRPARTRRRTTRT